MTCQCRLTDCDKCMSLMGDVGEGRDCASVEKELNRKPLYLVFNPVTDLTLL